MPLTFRGLARFVALLTLSATSRIQAQVGLPAHPGYTASETEPPQLMTGWTLCIDVYNWAGVSPDTLDYASKEAERVLLAARVPTLWNKASPDLTEEHTTDSTDRNCLVLLLRRRTPPKVHPGALGFALPQTQSGADATIFYDRIEGLARQRVSAGASVPQILGCVMAHEIGHVLLRSSDHSPGGIMKGPWAKAEFWRIAKGWLEFTTEQSEIMRQSAFRRAVLKSRNKRKSCIAGVNCTVGLVTAVDAAPFSVRIYNYAEVPEPTLAAAQGETALIFRQAGIDVSWLPCACSDAEFAKSPHKFTACAQATGAVTVRIQPKCLGGQAMRSHSWLAAAQKQCAEVFYDRLQQFAADQACKPALVLALVLAHELGHLLLGEGSHSSHGIMVPRFRTEELRRAQKGQLTFTPEHAQRMRDR